MQKQTRVILCLMIIAALLSGIGLPFGEQPAAADDCPIQTPWLRVEGQWYESIDAWRNAVIENPPEYTAPSWAAQGGPFLDSVSNFLRYKPDVDYLKDNPFIP